MIVGSVIRTSCLAENFNGETVVTTWDMRVEVLGSGGISAMREDLLEFINDMYANIAGYVSSTVTPDQLEFYSRLSADFIPPIAWTGMTFTASGDEMPANASAYLVIPTGQRGIRGRKFIFNTITDYNVGGELDAAYSAALLSLGSDWLNSGAMSNGWEFAGVVWSSTNTLAYLPLDIVVGTQWGTTTRRKTGN